MTEGKHAHMTEEPRENPMRPKDRKENPPVVMRNVMPLVQSPEMGRDYIGVEDIPGAQAGSRHRGIVSKRVTNPMDPVYHFLGMTKEVERIMSQKSFSQDRAAAMRNNRDMNLRQKEERKLLANTAKFYGLAEGYQQVNLIRFRDISAIDLERFRNVDTGTHGPNKTPVVNSRFLLTMPNIGLRLAEDPTFKDNRNKFFGADPEKSQS